MPTKPVVTFVVATDATFSSGPASGFATRVILPSPTQGNIPGTGAAAEHVNHPLGITGDWITDWISQGTFDPDEDAHLVETSSAGLISATRANVGASTAGGGVPTLTLTGPTSADASTLDARNTTSLSAAVAVISQQAATATGNTLIVQGTEGTGDLLNVNSVTNHAGRGIIISTNDGNPAPLRFIGRNLPSGGALGDVYVDNTADEERLRVFHEGAFQSVWTTPSGFARAFDTDRTQSSTAAAGFAPKVTAIFAAGDGLISGATVHVRATCEIGQSVTTGALNLRLRDLTAAADVIASEAQHANSTSTAADEKMVTLEADYSLPGSGARSFALEFESNGVATVYIRRASIEVTGQY
jgi:hypothetical protein